MFLYESAGILIVASEKLFFFHEQEAERNTKIKDHIRDTCVTELVDSWFQILVGGNLVFWYNNEVEVSLTVFLLCFVCRKHMKIVCHQ